MSEPIRVLHVVTYMGRGGLESMLMNYYRHIDRTRVQFDFLVHRQERHEFDDEIESLGGRIYRLHRLKPWSISYRRELNEFFRSHPEYKIVHCHVDCMSSIPLAAAKAAGVPVRLAHAHSSNQDKDFKYCLKLYYKRNIPKVATGLFACSEAAGKWMFQCDDFCVLPNAIDAKQYSYNSEIRDRMRKSFGLSDELVIGHVGRFSPVKNHAFIFKILKQLLSMGENVKLLSVGTGRWEEEIKQNAHDMGLDDSIVYAGMRTDVADCMQAMDVFILPSLYEGLPVTMIEAQASGLPCLISDRVPIECKKTNLVEQMQLESGAEAWAEAAIRLADTKRVDTYRQIVASGFDVRENAQWLQKFYCGLYENL